MLSTQEGFRMMGIRGRRFLSAHTLFDVRRWKFPFSARHSIFQQVHPLTVTTTLALALIKGYRMAQEEGSRISKWRPQVPRVQPRWEARSNRGPRRRLKRLSPMDECVRRPMAAEDPHPRHLVTVLMGVSWIVCLGKDFVPTVDRITVSVLVRTKAGLARVAHRRLVAQEEPNRPLGRNAIASRDALMIS